MGEKISMKITAT